ncbi:MAG TPA: hypothetical protein VI636_14810 [Candidatus Angelobacter sp.]
MNQSEERLAKALRELASCSRQSAAPELAVSLKDAFRHHHAQRRQRTRVRIVLACLCMTALSGWFLLKNAALHNNSAQINTVHMIPSQEVSPSAEISVSTTRQAAALNRPAPRRKTSADVGSYWALPSFDLIPSGDQLRVVRLQMRGEDLRLVGAPVTEEIVRRRVTADFVVGHDGTPYAVKLVQANF